MRSVINVSNIRSQKDVTKIRSALGNAEGVMACSIRSEKGIIEVVYDDFFIKYDQIQDLLENMGYTII